MRRVSVVTVGRSDFGIYLPVLRAIEDDPRLSLNLIVTGAHLTAEFGWTVREIQSQGFRDFDRVDLLLSSDTPVAIAKSMGLGTVSFAQQYDQRRPDVLLVLGDRFEMHAAAVAAVPMKIPIAHLHGGEVTQGAIDDMFRHAITKYSHLHFVSTPGHARRVIQLGEQPWRVTVSGAPGIDAVKSTPLLDRDVLEKRLDIPLDVPPLLVTFHPVTLQHERTEHHIDELIEALSEQDRPVVVTKPNADTNGRMIIAKLEQFSRRCNRVRVVDNLGSQAYFTLMRYAAAMVGNSSSGLIEAASFELPVVNIGDRQKGRERGSNVIDCGHRCSEIRAAIERAVGGQFREQLAGQQNPYGDGDASQVIVDRLATIDIDQKLLQKEFHDLDRQGEPRLAA